MGIKIYNSKLGNGLSSIQRKHRGILTATSVYLHFTCTFYMQVHTHMLTAHGGCVTTAESELKV